MAPLGYKYYCNQPVCQPATPPVNITKVDLPLLSASTTIDCTPYCTLIRLYVKRCTIMELIAVQLIVLVSIYERCK